MYTVGIQTQDFLNVILLTKWLDKIFLLLMIFEKETFAKKISMLQNSNQIFEISFACSMQQKENGLENINVFRVSESISSILQNISGSWWTNDLFKSLLVAFG